MRKRPDRGGIAIEFAFTMPMLMLTIAGGLQIGRAVMTRHSLAHAVSYATRKAAVAAGAGLGAISNGAIQADINMVMASESAWCNPLTLTVKPITFPGGQAVAVTAVCKLQPLFKGDWSTMGVPSVTVNAAMPY